MRTLCCGLISLFLLSVVVPAASEVVMVLDLFRHGARNPLDRGSGEEDGGELTPVGLRQSYLLGNYIRKRYLEDAKLLSPTYNFNEISVISTDTNRSLMSAQAHLVGLYENTMPNYDKTKQRFIPPINVRQDLIDSLQAEPNVLPKALQPIAVVTREKDNDRVLYPTKVCNDQFKHMEEDSYVYDDKIRALEREMTDFAGQIAEKMKRKGPLNLKDLRKICGSLMAREASGEKIVPTILTDEEYRKLQFIYDYIGMNKYAGTERIRQVIATPLMQAMIGYFDGKINVKDNPGKLIVMSGHDTTMIALLASLKILNSDCMLANKNNYNPTPECPSIPRFAANIFVELHKDGENYAVKFFYNDLAYDICGDGKPGDKLCPYDAFKAKITRLQYDFDVACLLNGVPPFPSQPFYLLLIVTFVLSIACGIIYWRLRSLSIDKH